MKPLQHKKHTLAKRGLSVLCILALCLGLLPVTALAADEIELYVGGQRITESGCYENQGGTWTKVASTGPATEPTSGQFSYDASTATLTLNNVSIEGGSGSIGTISLQTTDSVASLTIELMGENYLIGSVPIWVSADKSGASLTITGGGTLTTTGTAMGTGGIFVQSGPMGSENQSDLTIEGGANVISKCTQSTAVTLVAPAAGEAILTVQGGNLIADGGSSAGIYYGKLDGTVPSNDKRYLRIANNSILRTNRLSYATGLSVSIQYQSEPGGIYMNGGNGIVYGSVTLQDNLIIGEGESLKLFNNSSNLFAEPYNVIVDGGTLDESLKERLGDSVKYAPTLTTHPQNVEVKEKETATFTVEATGSEPLSYQWQQKTSSSDWTDITGETNATYTTGQTTMNMNGTQYRCVVTGSGKVAESNVATLTVTAPTTYTITATANPAEGGTVTVNGGETSATVTEGREATLTATANEGWRFAGWMENDQRVSTDATFTFKATGDRTLTAEFEKVYNVTVNSTAGGTATADKTTAAAGETVTLTATPNSGYHFAGWNVVSGTVTIQDKQFIMPANDVDIQAIFARNTSPTIPPTVSEKTIDAIQDAEPGETVTVDLSHGSTTLDKEVFETLAGKDITLAIDLGDGVSWTVNGSDIPENAKLADIDLGVTMNSDGIPVDLINAITGEHGSVQMTLAHDGAFGFTMTLTAPLGAENAGYWANLYHYKVNDGEAGREGPLGDNEDANAMTFETAAEIGDDGSVSLAFSHASQYAIVIDDHNHGVVELPFTDVSEGDWFYDSVCFVCSQGLMTGTSATTFEPNTPLTRAMLVAMLHRLEGSPAASGGDFTDVAEGDWYAQAVNWAASVGVVNGFDDGTFQPNAAITREQLAAILRNYAQYKGLDVSASGDLSTYSDANSVSSWAKESVTWAVGEGLLSGMTVDTLQPQGLSTRAQVAAVLQRYLEK